MQSDAVKKTQVKINILPVFDLNSIVYSIPLYFCFYKCWAIIYPSLKIWIRTFLFYEINQLFGSIFCVSRPGMNNFKMNKVVWVVVIE